MEKNEITVGREGEYRVDATQYRFVSGQHARIMRRPDGVYIEDLNSRNGTFVNGYSVKSKKVGADDAIFLGGANHYRLDLESVLRQLPMSDAEFSSRFLQLKTVYNDYTEKIEQLEQKMQGNMRVLSMLPMTFTGILIGILSPIAPENLRIFIIIFGGLLTISGLIFGSKLSSKKMASIKREIKKLQEQFREEYVCPDCTRELGIQTSWEFWQRRGKCPACSREWKIQENSFCFG
jgi:ribosomal protein L37AE/L43A